MKLGYKKLICQIFIKIFLILTISTLGFAQTSSTIVVTNLEKSIPLDCWLYQSGDNPIWALPNYDDKSWQILNLNNQEKPFPLNWPGIGWFRLHLEFSQSFIESQTPLALLVDHIGASEIYLDGKLIQKFGVASKEIQEQVSYKPNKIKPCIFIPKTTKQVLAIKYSFAEGKYPDNWKTKILINNLATKSIFNVELQSYEKTLDYLDKHYKSLSLQYVFLSINILLIITHLIIFYFYRFEKTNLYYSIFLILGFAQQGILVITNFGNYGIYHSIAFIILIDVLIWPLLFAFRHYYLSSILQKGFLNYKVLIFFSLIPLLSLVPITSFYTAGFILFLATFFILFLELVLSVRNAYKQKIPLIWVFSLSFAFLFIDLGFGTFFHLKGEYKSLTMAIVDTSCGISFFLTMSFYIAYKSKHYLDKLNASLEEKVEERTKELALSEQREKQANQAKSVFLATMSHEIRTPMNAVIGATNLLFNTKINPEQEDLLTTIHTSGEALLNIINDILDFSKIESGYLELETIVFDLRNALEESLDLVSPKCAEKNLNLAYFWDNNVPDFIEGDLTRLKQILINLLSNAVKFTSTGEIILKVENNKINNSFCELHFTVKDTGIGIAKDKIPKLFQAFTQIEKSTNRLYGGTGLGLAISKKLSNLMGGTIWVESTENQGSSFHFTILAKASEEKKHLYLYQPNKILSEKTALLSIKNTTHNQVLLPQLSTWGVKALEVADPLLTLETNSFDIIILERDFLQETLSLAKDLHKKKTATLIVVICSITEVKNIPLDYEWLIKASKPIKPVQLYNLFLNSFDKIAAKVETNNKLIDATLAQTIPLKILLAEDHFLNQKIAEKILNKMGYSIDIVSDGTEVLTALDSVNYDVILMDVQMPKLDGLETTKQIISLFPKETRPRIIAMTAGAVEGDREQCLAVGMDDYVSKPIDINALQEALLRCKK